MAIDGVDVADVEPVPAPLGPRGGRGREPLEAAVAGERVAAQVDLGVGQGTEAQLRPLQVDELVGVEVELPQVELVGEGAVLDLLDLVDVEADEGGRVGDGGGRDPPDLVVGEVERLDDQLRAEVVEVPNLGDPVGAQVEPSVKKRV